MLLKHKETGKIKGFKVQHHIDQAIANGWEPAEGHAESKPKKAKKKADPIVEDTHSEVEETKPITESKENEYGNN
jgi:vacuolar-type H+-ATPase subunit H